MKNSLRFFANVFFRKNCLAGFQYKCKNTLHPRILITVFILFSLPSFASEKILDDFTSSTRSAYYVNNLTANISTSVYYEGNSALEIQYTLANSTNGEILRTYSDYPLDLSFQSQSLNLMVNGSGSAAPTLKVMLYEDNDMDGNPFESGDEIFEYVNTSILSGAGWQQLSMPFTSFTKFGGGVGTLNLNHIYAWRIYLENTSGGSLNGTVYIDELKFISSYTIPSSISADISGTFIQLWNDATCGSCGSWNLSQWEQTFDDMKAVCINEVVVQYGVYATHSWYTPYSVGGVSTSSNTLNLLMQAAATKGMDVYIGLYFDGEFTQAGSGQSATYQTLASKDKQLIDDVWTLFGSNASFKGWYIPQEIHDLYWRTSTDQSLLFSWLDEISDYAKTKSSNKPVAVAPYVGPWMPADYVESWYTALFSTANNINEVWLQDGSGTFANRNLAPLLKDYDVDAPHYIAAVKSACDANSRIFGVDVELFSDPSPRIPAGIARVEDQIKVASAYTSRLFSFGWMFMQPGLSAATQDFYEDYSSFRNCILTNVISETGETSDRKKGKVYDLLGRFLGEEKTFSGKGIFVIRYEDGFSQTIIFNDE